MSRSHLQHLKLGVALGLGHVLVYVRTCGQEHEISKLHGAGMGRREEGVQGATSKGQIGTPEDIFSLTDSRVI